MQLTVEDIYNFPKLNSLKLIAGKTGLNNIVKTCGILDYELDEDAENKYYDYNFQFTNFLTLSSFLYAKNNESLIFEAVKKLVNKNCSGLIIKNVFNLNISPNIIRYADYMEFPIFIIEGTDCFFEDIIIQISKWNEHYSSLEYCSKIANKIIHLNNSNSEAKTLAYEINTSLKNEFFCIYLKPVDTFGETTYLEAEKVLYDSNYFTPNDSIFYYNEGIMIIHSKENFEPSTLDILINPIINIIESLNIKFQVGISKHHHFIHNLGLGFKEAICSAAIHRISATNYQLYDELGAYQIIFPFADNKLFINYSEQYISLIIDYDIENNTDLLKTLCEFISCEGDVGLTAKHLFLHHNTIRYRLKQINAILNMNILDLGDYSKISLATHIYLCK